MKNTSRHCLQAWERLKQQHPDTLLLLRLGDFYETFHDDAATVARELNITLTRGDGAPMCGVPYHAVHRYVAELVEKGYKCALCERTPDQP